MAAALILTTVMMTGCGAGKETEQASGTQAGAAEKVFTYGTTGFGVEMGDEGVDPHNGYFGWSCLRYGVGETLFKFSDAMEPEPWLATGYEFIDDNTCLITLREGVTFSSGRVMDGEAVKECLEDLIARHDRAPSDTGIDSVTADGMTVTIHTAQPCPALINYLCDPYGCIIDMAYGVQEDSNVAGTGPFIAEKVTDTEWTLVKNPDYWGGDVKLDKVIIKSIMDGDTLTNALQAGDIDAAYGMPYASYSLFESDDFTISSAATSRSFFGQFNSQSEIMQDAAVRQAICMGIDKEGFVDVLLNGKGEPAEGPFPASFTFGDSTVKADAYDPDGARKILEEAGWTDTDGDGIREKDGQRLTVRWLTYPGRMELPLLAESAQASLKDIGIEVDVNSSQDHLTVVADPTAYDLYVSALVTAPTGDPEYFFTTCTLDASAKNRGFYHSDALETLAADLHVTFDPAKRAELATQMQQLLLDDHAYFFASHLQMSILARKGVTGLTAHPCDYYEVTADLDLTD